MADKWRFYYFGSRVCVPCAAAAAVDQSSDIRTRKYQRARAAEGSLFPERAAGNDNGLSDDRIDGTQSWGYNLICFVPQNSEATNSSSLSYFGSSGCPEGTLANSRAEQSSLALEIKSGASIHPSSHLESSGENHSPFTTFLPPPMMLPASLAAYFLSR